MSRQLPMPSLYLARGDRLRCLAQRGYWHVQDGLPFSVGVAGRTYRSGKSIRVLAQDAPEFTAPVPGIAEEVCVPIRVGSEVVGVLNVESMELLPPDALPIVQECAQLFGDRLAALGGPPLESTADQLGRHAARLAAMTQTDELWSYVVNAACDLVGMSSGAMIDLSQPNGARVAAAVGAIGARLHEVPGSDWATIASQVCHGTSCHTAGWDAGAAFVGYQALRGAGAEALIIVPVFADGECRALLVCADGRPAAPCSGLVEQLELLAAQLGSCLQTLGALEELRGRTMQDPLTGLGNRIWFVAMVQERLEAWSRRGAGQFAVMFCDLDGFKDVNDSIGHAAGDQLLITVADRLRDRTYPNELIARLGGDEFGLCSDRFLSVSDAFSRATAVANLMAPHFDLDGVEVSIPASVGIAIVSWDDPSPPDASTLLREADAAMYEAKRRGRSGVALFTDDLRRAASERLAIATGLRKSVADDQLVLLYQPVVGLPGGKTVGMEALLRWQHPDRGLLAPADFISIAEDSGLILELGTWALRTACAQLAHWDRTLQRTEPLTVGVNLSPRQLADPSLPAIVASTLATSGIDPSRLILEITESTLMEDVASAHFVLAELKHIGVLIAVDDFGTGFSSLAYLKRFPVDILKIDGSFIDGLPDDAESRAIVAAIVAMAKALGLDLVAEGVESEAQRESLTNLGCPNAQGYLFAVPHTAEKMTRLLERGPVAPVAV
ncbi:MAG: EAL domain-containing protein [Geodermatophilaceae bacterium]